jgi:membrane-associated phospholipid phosphatase
MPASARPATDLRHLVSRPSPQPALWIAGLCLLGLGLTWVVAALVPIAHTKDAVALYDFTRLGRPRVDLFAERILHLLEPGLYAIWAVALVVLMLVRRHPRLALATAVVLPLAPLSAEVLKPLLAHPHAYAGLDDITAASWPSGHATAATTLALCAVLAVPYALRPLVAALGFCFVLGVSVSLLILAWHMPSDVLGGYLLAGLWVSVAVAIVRASERSRPNAAGQAPLRRTARGVSAMRAGLPQ